MPDLVDLAKMTLLVQIDRAASPVKITYQPMALQLLAADTIIDNINSPLKILLLPLPNIIIEHLVELYIKYHDAGYFSLDEGDDDSD